MSSSRILTLSISALLTLATMPGAQADEASSVPVSGNNVSAQGDSKEGRNSSSVPIGNADSGTLPSNNSEGRTVTQLEGTGAFNSMNGGPSSQSYYGTVSSTVRSLNRPDKWDPSSARLQPGGSSVGFSLTAGQTLSQGDQPGREILGGRIAGSFFNDSLYLDIGALRGLRLTEGGFYAGYSRPLGSGDTAVRLLGGLGFVGKLAPKDERNDYPYKQAAGFMARAEGETYLGDHLSLAYGLEAKLLFPSDAPNPYAVVGQQKGKLSTRISTNRNSKGSLVYVEPSVVYQRTSGFSATGTEPAEEDVMYMINVGVGVSNGAR